MSEFSELDKRERRDWGDEDREIPLDDPRQPDPDEVPLGWQPSPETDRALEAIGRVEAQAPDSIETRQVLGALKEIGAAKEAPPPVSQMTREQVKQASSELARKWASTPEEERPPEVKAQAGQLAERWKQLQKEEQGPAPETKTTQAIEIQQPVTGGTGGEGPPPSGRGAEGPPPQEGGEGGEKPPRRTFKQINSEARQLERKIERGQGLTSEEQQGLKDLQEERQQLIEEADRLGLLDVVSRRTDSLEMSHRALARAETEKQLAKQDKDKLVERAENTTDVALAQRQVEKDAEEEHGAVYTGVGEYVLNTRTQELRPRIEALGPNAEDPSERMVREQARRHREQIEHEQRLEEEARRRTAETRRGAEAMRPPELPNNPVYWMDLVHQRLKELMDGDYSAANWLEGIEIKMPGQVPIKDALSYAPKELNNIKIKKWDPETQSWEADADASGLIDFLKSEVQALQSLHERHGVWEQTRWSLDLLEKILTEGKKSLSPSAFRTIANLPPKLVVRETPQGPEVVTVSDSMGNLVSLFYLGYEALGRGQTQVAAQFLTANGARERITLDLSGIPNLLTIPAADEKGLDRVREALKERVKELQRRRYAQSLGMNVDYSLEIDIADEIGLRLFEDLGGAAFADRNAFGPGAVASDASAQLMHFETWRSRQKAKGDEGTPGPRNTIRRRYPRGIFVPFFRKFRTQDMADGRYRYLSEILGQGRTFKELDLGRVETEEFGARATKTPEPDAYWLENMQNAATLAKRLLDVGVEHKDFVGFTKTGGKVVTEEVVQMQENSGGGAEYWRGHQRSLASAVEKWQHSVRKWYFIGTKWNYNESNLHADQWWKNIGSPATQANIKALPWPTAFAISGYTIFSWLFRGLTLLTAPISRWGRTNLRG